MVYNDKLFVLDLQRHDGVIYLILEMLYQRFMVGAKGLEQIPNYLMWREFGTLQAVSTCLNITRFTRRLQIKLEGTVVFTHTDKIKGWGIKTC